jgi:hypothetical protein
MRDKPVSWLSGNHPIWAHAGLLSARATIKNTLVALIPVSVALIAMSTSIAVRLPSPRERLQGEGKAKSGLPAEPEEPPPSQSHGLHPGDQVNESNILSAVQKIAMPLALGSLFDITVR